MDLSTHTTGNEAFISRDRLRGLLFGAAVGEALALSKGSYTGRWGHATAIALAANQALVGAAEADVLIQNALEGEGRSGYPRRSTTSCPRWSKARIAVWRRTETRPGVKTRTSCASCPACGCARPSWRPRASLPVRRGRPCRASRRPLSRPPSAGQLVCAGQHPLRVRRNARPAHGGHVHPL